MHPTTWTLAAVITLISVDVAEPQDRTAIIAHRGASATHPECTLAAIRRAIEVGADVVEVDVRTSKDGVLFLLHDPTLDRTTDGSGLASERTIAELKKLDAGVRFDEAFRGERIPTLREALELGRGKIDVLLDLKEVGEAFARRVAEHVRMHGDPAGTVVGVRSVEQARLFRGLLPRSRQLGLILGPRSIEAFVEAGVGTIRLWPSWLTATDGGSILKRVRESGSGLHLNGAKGTVQEVLPLLRHGPRSLSADDPATLKATLLEVGRHRARLDEVSRRVAPGPGATVVPWIAGPAAATFLNRDYRMLELPEALHGQPRMMFSGGEGDRVVLRFTEPSVVFAAFEYNSSGAWTFPGGHSPRELGWSLLSKDAYRGTSNAGADDRPHRAHVHCREFAPGERLEEMPGWWLCLAIVGPEVARGVPGFAAASSGAPRGSPPFLHGLREARSRPLRVPEHESREQWAAWQSATRAEFRRRLVYAYDDPTTIAAVGEPTRGDGIVRRELHVSSGGRRLFRFFKLTPGSVDPSARDRRRATIVCFMGHGKVEQILEAGDSYQRACAARFAAKGYLVFAMENVGMGPDRDTHHELDRVLRLSGHGWYSLLFAHQRMLLDHVFADPMVDAAKVAVTGVSTGGLLALSAIAMEPRVAAASVQGIFGSMRVSFIRDRDRHCSCGAIPGLLPAFDLPELAVLATPRPLHISNARGDGFSPSEARRCVRQVAPICRSAGGPEPVFSEPPGGHEYAFEPALAFFESTIGSAE